jgi:hypothetical protein
MQFTCAQVAMTVLTNAGGVRISDLAPTVASAFSAKLSLDRVFKRFNTLLINFTSGPQLQSQTSWKT